MDIYTYISNAYVQIHAYVYTYICITLTFSDYKNNMFEIFGISRRTKGNHLIIQR